jgi:hypothetical protein
MEHIYHVQNEVVAYYQHIPKVPEDVAIDKKLLFDMTERQFVENMCYFTELMKKMYVDMEVRPEEYGLMLIDINKVNENKAEGNLAKASWRSVKRLGDVIAQIGKLGEIENDKLRLPVADFKASLKKVEKLSLILNKLIDFGFTITDFDGKSFNKGSKTFYIAYPKNLLLMSVLKAYSIAEPFHEHDPHEFYYFDYKRVADREKLPTHCVAKDLADLIDEEKGKLLVEINKCFVDDLGISPHYKDDSIEYYLKKKRVARFIIDFHDLNAVLILKLKDMDKYIEQIERLPDNLRKHFEKGNCRFCGFQNSTVEYCKYRIKWTLSSSKYNACNFSVFNFNNPKETDALHFVELIRAEYKIS